MKTDNGGILLSGYTIKPRLERDTISFSAKKYDADSITNPTNHCGYCGCKIYTEEHIESIAKEMMNLKSERLQGKIKSILEKLDGAKYSEELALAKRLENRDEIEFFKDFLDISMKKPFLKGEAIFDQTYNLNSEEAIALLTKKMHPLLKTIDHISPQNRKEDNYNADINLVEACYCCNHDLKKGVTFNEFYTMFPSIENNMPQDKFKYAVSHVLENGQSGINQRLSAGNVLKSLQRLLIQRNDIVNNLKSIDYRITGLQSQINETISSIQHEISSKKSEITEIEAKLEELNNDDEFNALRQREQLETSLTNTNVAINSLNERYQNVSDSINKIRNPQKSAKKNKNQTKNENEDEKNEQRLEELKQILLNIQENIKLQSEKKLDIEKQLEDLNLKFPAIETLQSEKKNLETILSLYISLQKEQTNIDEKTEEKNNLETQISTIENKISLNPFTGEEFEQNSYTEDEKSAFKRYQAVTGAILFIEQHPNGGDVNFIIKQAAKPMLETELQELEKNPIVIDYQNSKNKTDLNNELNRLKKELENVNSDIMSGNKKCRMYEEKVSMIDEKSAKSRLDELNMTIKRLNDKQNELKISQKIKSLEAEIDILHQTIEDLQNQKNNIPQNLNV